MAAWVGDPARVASCRAKARFPSALAAPARTAPGRSQRSVESTALRCRARAAPALAVRARLPRSGKPSRLVRSLRSSSRLSRDARGRQMPGALMRRWSRGIYADHRDRTRREESPRRFSGSDGLRWHADEARLRSAWPAPDGRGRPAPARPGRAARHPSKCFQICSRARAAVRAGQRERAGLDRVKRACSVMAALGWGPSAGRERQGGRRVFPRPR